MSLYRLCHFRSGLSATVIKEYCIVLYCIIVSNIDYLSNAQTAHWLDAKFVYLMVNTEAEFLLKRHMGMRLFVKKNI